MSFSATLDTVYLGIDCLDFVNEGYKYPLYDPSVVLLPLIECLPEFLPDLVLDARPLFCL